MIYLGVLAVVLVFVAGCVWIVTSKDVPTDEPPRLNPSAPPGTRFCPSDGTDCSMADCATGCEEVRMIQEFEWNGGAAVRATKPAGCEYPRCIASTGDCYGPCWDRETALRKSKERMLRRRKFPRAASAGRVGIAARFARSRVR